MPNEPNKNGDVYSEELKESMRGNPPKVLFFQHWEHPPRQLNKRGPDELVGHIELGLHRDAQGNLVFDEISLCKGPDPNGITNVYGEY